MNKPMDVKLQKLLIKISLDYASTSDSDDLEEIFLKQAKRLQVELDKYLKKTSKK